MTNTAKPPYSSSPKAKARGGGGKRKYTRKFDLKRPLSAYNLFFRAERERILKEALGQDEDINTNRQTTKKGKRAHRKSHGALKFSDMGKRIAAAWKGLDEEARAPFLTEAALEMERYQEAKSQLLASQPVSVQNNDKSEHEHPTTESLHNESGDHSGTSSSSQNNQTNPSNSYSQHEQQQHQQQQQMERNNIMGQETTNDPNQTAQAFAPPYPSNYSGNLLHQEYAYQCEVCLTAIFPTYDECARHEEECAKSKMKAQNEEQTLV